MQNHKMALTIACVFTSLFLASCATTHVPSHWLPDPAESATDAYGAWIEIESKTGPVYGELIAVAGDTVFLADSALLAVALSDVVSARIICYDASNLGAYVLLGTLSTISNGIFLLGTAPMWLIGGSIAAINRYYDPIIEYPDKPPKEFASHARFPEGLPTNVDRRLLKRKGIR